MKDVEISSDDCLIDEPMQDKEGTTSKEFFKELPQKRKSQPGEDNQNVEIMAEGSPVDANKR